MKYIIFDFDGTIANSSIVFMHAWNEYADQYSYKKVSEHDIAEARTMTLQQCAKKFHFPMYKMPIILPKIYSYLHQRIDEVLLYDGMHEALQYLADEGYTLYILSSNNRENIEAFLNKEGIDVIEEVLTASKLFGKDRVLKKFMKQNQIAAADIFYIGDELRDAEACQKCAIDFGWVSWGLQGYDIMKQMNPNRIFETPADIVEQL